MPAKTSKPKARPAAKVASRPAKQEPVQLPLVEPAPAPRVDEPAADAAAPKLARRATAEQMATRQREISISEFFTKNRHLLGFDSPSKALLTAVKEAFVAPAWIVASSTALDSTLVTPAGMHTMTTGLNSEYLPTTLPMK